MAMAVTATTTHGGFATWPRHASTRSCRRRGHQWRRARSPSAVPDSPRALSTRAASASSTSSRRASIPGRSAVLRLLLARLGWPTLSRSILERSCAPRDPTVRQGRPQISRHAEARHADPAPRPRRRSSSSRGGCGARRGRALQEGALIGCAFQEFMTRRLTSVCVQRPTCLRYCFPGR